MTAITGRFRKTRSLIGVEAGDTSATNFGLAVDIGTTTLAVKLLDLKTGRVRARASAYNQQASFGADVISRIIHAQKDDGLYQLEKTVTDDLNCLIAEVSETAGISSNDITAAVCSGNMTMLHLLLGIDPTYLRREPYAAVTNFFPCLKAEQTRIRINPQGTVQCLPGVASYVGADISAGVVACGMADSEQLCLFIDIGTNGEIVLGSRDWLVCCASSAGPAFEGAGISSGMRADPGAIEKIIIQDGRCDYETIGRLPANGICGSGLVELLSELFREKVIDRSGKFISEDGPGMRRTKGGLEFLVAGAKETGTRDIVINADDIENLIRSKAAVFAAVSVILQHLSLDFTAIERVFIAGGFGTGLNISKAVSIGLLPPLEEKRFSFIGNSSLSGALDCLADSNMLDKVGETARKMTYFELGADNSFMDEYTKALFLPHTELERFK